MPIKLSYSAIRKRFDFAVPLEDIFTKCEVHPRLKYIFQQAYEHYIENNGSIEDVLNDQWCLNECLQLKHNVIYEIQPGLNIQPTSVGVYFWIIRHFLGLLPVPLLPAINSTYKFPWKELSRKCKSFLQSNSRTEEECNDLYFSIARTLNYLPQEHISMLNTLVVFIREISKIKLYKTTMKCLSKYYCDAIFMRPYRPGHSINDQAMLPLLIFIIPRWYHILKYLKTEKTIPSFSYESDYTGLGMEKKYVANSCTQTSNFTTEFTSRKEPYTCVKYMKDIECQTDAGDSKTVTSCSAINLDQNKVDTNLQLIDNSPDTSAEVTLRSFNAPLMKRKMHSFVSSLIDINEDEEVGCETCQKFDIFNSTMINSRDNNWSDVVEEIARTVKKVKEYNYENDADQVGSVYEYKSVTSELSASTFDTQSSDTNYISFRNSTLKSAKNENFHSLDSTNRKSDKKHTQNRSLYRSFCSSDDELYNTKGKENVNDIELEEDRDERSSSNFSLKKLKIKFDFLRTLSPNLKRIHFKSTSSKNIKYKKI